MKKLFTVVLLGTMVSLAACESKKAETTSTETDTTATDTAAMSAATDTLLTDSTGAMSSDTTKK